MSDAEQAIRRRRAIVEEASDPAWWSLIAAQARYPREHRSPLTPRRRFARWRLPVIPFELRSAWCFHLPHVDNAMLTAILGDYEARYPGCWSRAEPIRPGRWTFGGLFERETVGSWVAERGLEACWPLLRELGLRSELFLSHLTATDRGRLGMIGAQVDEGVILYETEGLDPPGGRLIHALADALARPGRVWVHVSRPRFSGSLMRFPITRDCRGEGCVEVLAIH